LIIRDAADKKTLEPLATRSNSNIVLHLESRRSTK
jgi:hypothetical protein